MKKQTFCILLSLFNIMATYRANAQCRVFEAKMPLHNPQNPLSSQRERDGIYFLLSSLNINLESRLNPDMDSLQLSDCNDLKPEIWEQLKASVNAQGILKLSNFDEKISAAYIENRNSKNGPLALPLRLDEFRALTAFQDWPMEEIESFVKASKRRIYRSQNIVVAESVLDNGHIRETELMLKRQSSKNWDFYSYSPEGKLSETSEFPSGHHPTPAICLNCHYNRNERAFTPREMP